MMISTIRLFITTISFLVALAQTGKLPDPPDPNDILQGRGASDCSTVDKSNREVCERAIRERYEYDIESLHHRRDSFRWSLYASKIIFGVVLLLVLSGLIFAGIQFRIALARPVAGSKDTKNKQEKIPSAGGTEMATNLEISAQGIRVNSSVLGVIILTISMAFFYLYARYVYPIHELTGENPDVAQGPGK